MTISGRNDRTTKSKPVQKDTIAREDDSPQSIDGRPNACDVAPVFSFAIQHDAVADAIRRALGRDSQSRALGPFCAALDILAEDKI
jgi:hypothetical protein